MAEPINYMALAPQVDLGQKFLTGLQIGGGIADIVAKRNAAEQAAEMQKQYAADLQSTLANPSAKAFATLTAKYPAQREAFKQSWEILSKEQQDSDYLTGAQTYNAIASGNVDAAKNLVDERLTAMENSGQDTTKLKAIRTSLDQDPKQVQASLGLLLSSIDPDRWSKMAKESREQGLAPAEQRIKNAEAIIQEAKATAAGEEKTGIIPVEKRPEIEYKLRKEYSDQTKGFQDVSAAFARIKSSEDSAAGDMALIFNYMKMLDPGSVVREGEFASASNAGGVEDKIRNVYNKLLTGERLTPGQRKSFNSQAGQLYKAAGQQEKVVRAGLERISKGYGLDPANIFYEPGGVTPPSVPSPSAEAPVIAGMPAGFKVIGKR